MYSSETPHVGDSNDYAQHTIIVYKAVNTSPKYRHLLPDIAPWLTLSGSNYARLEQISMFPKMFGLLKFDFIFYFFHKWYNWFQQTHF